MMEQDRSGWWKSVAPGDRMERTSSRSAVAVLLSALLIMSGCDQSPGTPGPRGAPPDDDDKKPVAIDLSLSALTPEPSQGKVVLIDYEGPAFDESELRISVGGEALPATVSEDQIGVLLPLSHSGATLLAFDFGGGRSATMTLNIAMAPSIPDPRGYLETEINKLASALSELAAQESELRDLSDAVRVAQESLSALGEQEIAEAATLYKQNTGSSIDQPMSSGFLQTASLQAAALDANMCERAMLLWTNLHGIALGAGLAGGFLLNIPEGLVTKFAGTLLVALAATSLPEMIEHSVYVAVICVRPVVIGFFQPAHSIQTAQVGPAAALPRLSFRDGEPLAVTVTAAYRIQHDLRETFLNAMSKLRGQLLKFGTDVQPLCERCAAWLHRQADRIPQSVEKEAAVPANGFVLKGVSTPSITGRISGVDGDRLSLTFTVAESYAPETDDYIDFDFVLANGSIGLDDTTIPGRVTVDLEPTFDATVSDQTYEKDAAIAPLVLPAATRGAPPLTYSLTPNVPGLRFDAGTRTLSGTPTTARTYSMTYTVADVDGDSDTLSFTIEVTEPQQVPSSFDEGPIVRFYTFGTPVNVVLPTESGRADPLTYLLLFGDGTGPRHNQYVVYRETLYDGQGLRYDSTRRAITGAISGRPGDEIKPTFFLYMARTNDGDIAAKMYGAIYVMNEYRFKECGCNTLGCRDSYSPVGHHWCPPGGALYDSEPRFGYQFDHYLIFDRDVQKRLRLPYVAVTVDTNLPLTLSLTPDVPGLIFEPQTRYLTGKPTTSGTYPMTYTVTDVDGDSDTLSFTIEVTENVDTQPSFGVQTAADQTYTVGVSIAALKLPAASGGDGELTYALGPAVPGLSFDAATRTLSGTPGEAGTYTMTYTATDADDNTDAADAAVLAFTITVEEADPPNRSPVVVTPMEDLQVVRGATRTFALPAFFADPDGDPLMFSVSSSNTVVATIAIEGTLLTVAAVDLGVAIITVTAMDASASVTQSFSVQVTPAPSEENEETRHYMVYNLHVEPELDKPGGASTSCTPLPSSNWAAGSVTGGEQQFEEYRDSLWNRLGCGCCCRVRFASSAERQRSYGAIALSYSFDTPVGNYYCFAGSGVGSTLAEARNAALSECRRIGFSSSCKIVHEAHVPQSGGS